MSWKIDIDSTASKYLAKIDKSIRQKLIKAINQLTELDNPRKLGKALQGKYVGFWRYRIGDYRIICEIKDEIITILIIKIGHRKEIY